MLFLWQKTLYQHTVSSTGRILRAQMRDNDNADDDAMICSVYSSFNANKNLGKKDGGVLGKSRGNDFHLGHLYFSSGDNE